MLIFSLGLGTKTSWLWLGKIPVLVCTNTVWNVLRSPYKHLILSPQTQLEMAQLLVKKSIPKSVPSSPWKYPMVSRYTLQMPKHCVCVCVCLCVWCKQNKHIKSIFQCTHGYDWHSFINNSHKNKTLTLTWKMHCFARCFIWFVSSSAVRGLILGFWVFLFCFFFFQNEELI